MEAVELLACIKTNEYNNRIFRMEFQLNGASSDPRKFKGHEQFLSYLIYFLCFVLVQVYKNTIYIDRKSSV